MQVPFNLFFFPYEINSIQLPSIQKREGTGVETCWGKPPVKDVILRGTLKNARTSIEWRTENIPGIRNSQRKFRESRDGVSCSWNSKESKSVTGWKSACQGVMCKKTGKVEGK